MSAKLKHIAPGQLVRGDANETIFFNQELEHLKRKVYERQYPKLVGKSLIPASPDPVPPGVKDFRWYRMDINGAWAVIHGAAQNIPRVDLQMFEETGKCRTIADAFGWDIQDIEDSRISGKNISSARAMAARKILEEGLDETLYFGLVDYGHSAVTGLCNNANVTDVTVATRGGVVTWADKVAIDPEYVMQDVISAYNGICVLSKETEKPDTLALPPTRMRILTDNKVSPDNPRSLLEELKSRKPGLTFLESPRLETASDADGALGIMYVRDQDHLYFEEPRGFTMHPAFQKSVFEWEVACTAETGGCIWIAPTSAAYLTGL